MHKTRFIWLKNPWNLTEAQHRRLGELEHLNLKINRAYLLKEGFAHFWSYRRAGWAKRYLKRWFWWATHSRLLPLRDFAWMLRRHEVDILNYFRMPIDNGTVEGLNNKAKLIIHHAYGCRTAKNYIRNLYHCMADLPLLPPNRAYICVRNQYNFPVRAFVGLLTVAWVVSVGTLQAQDFTVFGGFQHPGILTLRSGVAGIGSAVGVQPGTSPDEVRIDPNDFGIFGIRLYRSGAPLGLEHTVAYIPTFIDTDGRAFLYSTNLRLELPAGRFRPYVTAGGGLFHGGGSGAAGFGAKYSVNYGGGVMVGFTGLIGLRFDARMYSIRGIDDHPLNLLESSGGIFVGF